MEAVRFVKSATALSLLGMCAAVGATAAGGGADGRFEKRESSHFVLLQDVDIDESGGFHGSRRFEQQVLKTLEAAYATVDELIGLRPRRKITVTIWDPAIFDARFAHLFRFPAAGFYGGTVHVRGGTKVDSALARVLNHELVHAAFDAAAPSLRLPAWLNEGTAEWVEARAIGKRWLSEPERRFLQQASARNLLFGLDQLSAGSFGGFQTDAARLAYLQSYAFIDYLARTYGDRRLRDLARELVRTGNLQRAVSKIFKRDLSRLEQAFRDSLRS